MCLWSPKDFSSDEVQFIIFFFLCHIQEILAYHKVSKIPLLCFSLRIFFLFQLLHLGLWSIFSLFLVMVWEKGLNFFLKKSEYTIIPVPLVKKTIMSLLEYTGTIIFENQSTIIGKVCSWTLNCALLIYIMCLSLFLFLTLEASIQSLAMNYVSSRLFTDALYQDE